MNGNGWFRPMAHGKTSVVTLVVLALASTTVTSCGGPSSTPGQGNPQVKRYGTIDQADYARPTVKRPGAFVVPGCCTLLTGSAKAEIMNSDSYVSVLNGDGFKAEIAFGFHEADESQNSERAAVQRVIDGVELRHAPPSAAVDGSAAGTRHLWSAEVPVTAAAKARGLVRPKLRVQGRCETQASCGQLVGIMDSIRF